MNKALWLLLVSTLLFSCWRSKKDYKFTVNLKDNKQYSGCKVNLYSEYYRNISGYMATDINSVYLTDSIKFRKYLGKYDEDGETISVKCKGDSILVFKTIPTSSIKEWNFPKVVERKNYSLKNLKRNNSFDW